MIVSGFQYPTRFLNWGTLFMVPVFGYCLWYAKYESKWKKALYGIGVAAVVLAVGTSSMYLIYRITYTYDRVRVFDNNVIRVLIPPSFNDTVSVRFVSPFYWRISEAVSGMAWLAVIAWCVWKVRERRRGSTVCVQ